MAQPTDLAVLSGILVIDKPAGLTSHDVVARVRRLVGIKRVGHGGTLDPFATGVLPIAVGRATRVLQFVQDSAKGYLAHVVLGVETDSGDVEGSIVSTATPQRWPGRDELVATLRGFVGSITQVPPAHSAIKVGGQRLYERARRGDLDVAVPARTVMIYGVEVRYYEPPDLMLGIACSKGTYIRALARDVGRALGTGAYCHTLRRTNTGPFCLGDAWNLETLGTIDVRAEWPRVALAADAALVGLPAVVLGEEQSRAWYHGRPVDLGHDVPFGTAGPVRVYDAAGRCCGVGQWNERGRVGPMLVFPAEAGAHA